MKSKAQAVTHDLEANAADANASQRAGSSAQDGWLGLGGSERNFAGATGTSHIAVDDNHSRGTFPTRFTPKTGLAGLARKLARGRSVRLSGLSYRAAALPWHFDGFGFSAPGGHHHRRRRRPARVAHQRLLRHHHRPGGGPHRGHSGLGAGARRRRRQSRLSLHLGGDRMRQRHSDADGRHESRQDERLFSVLGRAWHVGGDRHHHYGQADSRHARREAGCADTV